MPAAVAVPEAVSSINCNPVVVKLPAPVNLIPFAVLVVIVYVPMVVTFAETNTVLAAVTAVPAV